MPQLPEHVETARLLIRRYTVDDAEALVAAVTASVDHLRRGYATEISEALTSAAFTVPGIDRVEIHHDKANVASAGVPARLGYTLIAETPDDIAAPAEVGIDCAWRMSRTDWLIHPDPEL